MFFIMSSRFRWGEGGLEAVSVAHAISMYKGDNSLTICRRIDLRTAGQASLRSVGRRRCVRGFTGDFYGFAKGWMASQGNAVRLSAAGCAGGRRCSRTRPRTGPNLCMLRWRVAVSAFTTARGSESLRTRLGRRAPAAFGGCLRSKAGASGGRSSTRGDPSRPAVCWRPATVRLSITLLPAPRCLPAVLLVVARFWVPRRVIAVNGTSPVWRNQAASQLLWCCFVRLDTAKPARLAAPADAARDPEPNPRMVRLDPGNDMAGCVVLSGACGV